jgi:hypothetical protein
MRPSEQHLLDALGRKWAPAPPRAGYDFQHDGGRQVIELRISRGVRDLHAALLQLALAVTEHPSIERAFLIAQFPKMRRKRVGDEWTRVQQVLSSSAAKKLALIAIVGSEVSVLPDDAETRELAILAQNALRNPDEMPNQPAIASVKFFEVWKILLRRWLDNQGPLRIGELSKQAGCSYPTTARAIERMRGRREIEQDTSRSVRLRSFPRQTLRELLILSESLRRPAYFVDATGRAASPHQVLRRLDAKRPHRVALSGVVAARHYDPHFDLNGLPRLDIVMHTPIDLDWVSGIDPALHRASQSPANPVLVVRSLLRPTADFVETQQHKLPLADPVETLLDLYELQLDEQAEELVRTLRAKGDGG